MPESQNIYELETQAIHRRDSPPAGKLLSASLKYRRTGFDSNGLTVTKTAAKNDRYQSNPL